jgi:DNA-binding transcriptional LysR family regulator
MELNHLKYFHAVAKARSFTRAARALRVQQPAISKTVRLLEDQLGVVLLERHKNGVILTKAGEEIFLRCENIFSQVDEILTVSDLEKKDCHGLLSFAVTDAVSHYVLPSVLNDFLEDHPRVRPSIFAGSSNLIFKELLEGRSEFGLTFTQPDGDEFEVTELERVPFALVASTQHLKKQDLSDAFIISREIDYPKSRPFPVLEMLRRNKVHVNVVLSSNNLDFQKEMVRQGRGVALLPLFMVKSALSRGSFTRLQHRKDFSYPLSLVTRRRKLLSRNAATFIEHWRSLQAAAATD